MSFLTLLLAVLLLGAQAHAANGGWIDLPGDDPDTVKAAIQKEITDRYADGPDAPSVADAARRQAEQDAETMSQDVQTKLDTLRERLNQAKRKRNNTSEEVAQYHQDADRLAGDIENARRTIASLTQQVAEHRKELADLDTKLKLQLATQSVGDVVVAMVIDVPWNQTLGGLEGRADSLGSAEAVDELLTYIDATTLVKDGVLVRDTVERRAAGVAESVATKQHYVSGQRYVRLVTFRLYPLKDAPAGATPPAAQDGIRAGVVRDLPQLRAFLQQAGCDAQAVEKAVAGTGAVALLSRGADATAAARAAVRDALDAHRRKATAWQATVRDKTNEIARLNKNLPQQEKKLEKAQAALDAATQNLARYNGDAVAAQAALEKEVNVFRRYAFKRDVGRTGRDMSAQANAIELVLTALDAVRDEAKRHFSEAEAKVEKGVLKDDRNTVGNAPAKIRRFRLAYLRSQSGATGPEVEVGVLFETEVRNAPGHGQDAATGAAASGSTTAPPPASSLAGASGILQDTLGRLPLPVSPTLLGGVLLFMALSGGFWRWRVVKAKQRKLRGRAGVEEACRNLKKTVNGILAQLEQETPASNPDEPPAGGGQSPSAKTWTDPTTGMEFVWVPGGCFRMGSDNCGSDEKPVHEVCVDGFWLGKYAVTQAEWTKVMDNNPSHFKGDRNPVESVSWDDAQEFIRRLNGKGNGGFRLPTEAEWEYAARSGGKAETYAGGEDVDRVAWHDGNSGGKTHPVGGKAPNGLGLYDMSGNVWEWCQDWYGDHYYTSSLRANPTGPERGSRRVLRGGSWHYSPWDARSANRGRITPSSAGRIYGFRLSRTN
ncbi:MAG: SUMF1/EgtB/PvdO family nonheme iron enzyme [Desulfovibrionaceae bacterium]